MLGSKRTLVLKKQQLKDTFRWGFNGSVITKNKPNGLLFLIIIQNLFMDSSDSR